MQPVFTRIDATENKIVGFVGDGLPLDVGRGVN
jgi:hypothetical protein